MNPAELVVRVETGEDIHTEKERAVSADDLAALLVAFANTDGGQLIFGVNNRKQVVGIDEPDRLMQLIDIFLKLGLVTDAGSGVPRMVRLTRQATNQEPDFRVVGHEFIVALPRSSQLHQR